jgi:hypothetical protein
MTTPHQWAAEIHAMADGKRIQGCDETETSENIWETANACFNPLTHPHCQWRIKPEKQVLKYRVAKMQGNKPWLAFILDDKQANDIEKYEDFVEWLHDWQEEEVE